MHTPTKGKQYKLLTGILEACHVNVPAWLLAGTYLKDQHLAVMDVHGLAHLPSDKVYEAWSLKSGISKPIGILQVASSGDVLASMPLGDAGVDQIAATVEQAPGVDQPTTQPIFSAAFS